jgi:protein SCO1/2
MLCTQVLNGLTSSLSLIKFNAGQEFDVLAVSFDPGEGPGLARDKKKSYMERYKRPGTEGGFHFLTGKQDAIDRLTDAVGFRYAYDEKTDQYAHATTLIVLTPEGHVSRYFYGIESCPGRAARPGRGVGNGSAPRDQVLLPATTTTRRGSTAP